ncbi:MAG: PPOX class F420-dependent oxidoreductase [Nitrososphaera sp.]|jgi:PPOX class probable F420-dependent enzyme
MTSDSISDLAGQKYLNVETYRKSGRAVSTPVWFTVEGGRIFVVTRSDTGKIKRLRNNSNVRFMPCGSRGQPKGEWRNGTAALCNAEELEIAVRGRNKKYGFQAKLTGLLSRSKGDLVAFAISPA